MGKVLLVGLLLLLIFALYAYFVWSLCVKGGPC